MAKYRTYDYDCDDCGWTDVLMFDVSEADAPDKANCKGCGNTAYRRGISAPMVLKASYPDGTKRKGWQEAKQYHKLERAKRKAFLKNQKEEVKRADQEIRRFQKTDKSGGGYG